MADGFTIRFRGTGRGDTPDASVSLHRIAGEVAEGRTDGRVLDDHGVVVGYWRLERM